MVLVLLALTVGLLLFTVTILPKRNRVALTGFISMRLWARF